MKDPPFVVSKSAQPQNFSCDFLKLGPKRAKIGKYIGICMENAPKII